MYILSPVVDPQCLIYELVVKRPQHLHTFTLPSEDSQCLTDGIICQTTTAYTYFHLKYNLSV